LEGAKGWPTSISTVARAYGDNDSPVVVERRLAVVLDFQDYVERFWLCDHRRQKGGFYCVWVFDIYFGVGVSRLRVVEPAVRQFVAVSVC